MQCKPEICDVRDTATYSFEYTRTTLGMPALDVTPELCACIVYTIVIILILDRSCETVTKHALCEGW